MLFNKKKFKSISMDEAKKQLQTSSNIKLLDVRTVEEYRLGHLPNSINIPLDQIKSLQEDKEVPLFVYCQSGMRSKTACQKLTAMGYINITNIGGIVSWKGIVER